MKKLCTFIMGILLCPSFLTAQESHLTASTTSISTTVSSSTSETPEKEEDEVDSSLKIGGSVDAYYRINLGADSDAAPGTSFANLPGFSLGMINVTLAKSGKKVGFMADLVVGPRGEDATFLSPVLRPGGNSSILNQLYVFWNINDKITATLGNFNTFLGYEVISPTGNFNYSTSYLFSYGPFSHTGLKFDFAVNEQFSIMAGLFNPTDATEFNPLNRYVGGLQLGYDFGRGSVYLNSLFDDEFFQIDLTGGMDINDRLYTGINASFATDNFWGVAAYIQAKATEQLKIGTRLEYFADQGIEVIGNNETVLDATLSANYTIGNLTIIPEYRIDLASTTIFPNDEANNKSLSSFVLAVVYGF